MTVNLTTPPRKDYDGTGSTDTYPYDFPVSSGADLKVVERDADGIEHELALNTDYTVIMLTASSGNVIRQAGNLPTGHHWTVLLNLPYTQPISIRNQGEFYEEVHERAFDRNVLLVKQLQEVVSRSVVLPITMAGGDGNVKNLIPGYALGINATGDGLECVPNTGAEQSADLANTTNAAKGAGLVGFTYALSYGAGTVGKAIKDVMDAEEPVGQVRFGYVSAVLCRLSRHNGRFLTIGGVRRTVPAVGVDLSSTGFLAGTLYYVYAYWTGSAIALEKSTTGHSTDTETGVEIKTGDATRTLVGMSYCKTNGVFTETVNQKLIASWFHPRTVVAKGNYTIARTISPIPPAYAPFHAEILTEVVVWARSPFMRCAFSSYVSTGTTTYVFVGISVDGTAGPGVAIVNTIAANCYANCSHNYKPPMSEGYHSANILGASGLLANLTINPGGLEVEVEI